MFLKRHLSQTFLRCQTYSGELPTRCWLKEIAIGCTHVNRGCDAGSSTQNRLTAHDLAVVFTQRTRKGFVTRITGVRTRRPFPAVPEKLFDNLHRPQLQGATFPC